MLGLDNKLLLLGGEILAHDCAMLHQVIKVYCQNGSIRCNSYCKGKGNKGEAI